MDKETSELYKERMKLLFKLFTIAIIGLMIALCGKYLLKNIIGNLMQIASVLIIPFFFYFLFIPIVHWKNRYVGQSSNLWAILFILSAGTGIGIIVIPPYYILNVIPDIRGTDKYSSEENKSRKNIITNNNLKV